MGRRPMGRRPAASLTALMMVLALVRGHIESPAVRSHVEADVFTAHTDLQGAWDRLERRSAATSRNQHVLFSPASGEQVAGLHVSGGGDDGETDAEAEAALPVLPPLLPHPVHTTTLVSGMTVLSQQHHESPVVAIYMWFSVGSRNEDTTSNGISHLLEHLLFKGTEKRPIQFGKFFTLMGRQANAFTSYDETVYHTTVEKQHLLHVLTLEADRMRNAQISVDDVESEKTVVKSELGGNENSPFNKLQRVVMNSTFGRQEYGLPIGATMADVATLNQRQIKRFYKFHYAPSNCTLVVVGDFESHALIRTVVDVFRSPVKDTTIPAAAPSEVLVPFWLLVHPLFLPGFNPYFWPLWPLMFPVLPDLAGVSWQQQRQQEQQRQQQQQRQQEQQQRRQQSPHPPSPSPSPTAAAAPATGPAGGVQLDPYQPRHLEADVDASVDESASPEIVSDVPMPAGAGAASAELRLHHRNQEEEGGEGREEEADDVERSDSDRMFDQKEQTAMPAASDGHKTGARPGAARSLASDDLAVGAPDDAAADGPPKQAFAAAAHAATDSSWMSSLDDRSTPTSSFLEVEVTAAGAPPPAAAAEAASSWTDVRYATVQMDVYAQYPQSLTRPQALNALEGCLSRVLSDTVGQTAQVQVQGYTAPSQGLEQLLLRLPARFVAGLGAATVAGRVLKHVSACLLPYDTLPTHIDVGPYTPAAPPPPSSLGPSGGQAGGSPARAGPVRPLQLLASDATPPHPAYPSPPSPDARAGPMPLIETVLAGQQTMLSTIASEIESLKADVRASQDHRNPMPAQSQPATTAVAVPSAFLTAAGGGTPALVAGPALLDPASAPIVRSPSPREQLEAGPQAIPQSRGHHPELSGHAAGAAKRRPASAHHRPSHPQTTAVEAIADFDQSARDLLSSVFNRSPQAVHVSFLELPTSDADAATPVPPGDDAAPATPLSTRSHHRHRRHHQNHPVLPPLFDVPAPRAPEPVPAPNYHSPPPAAQGQAATALSATAHSGEGRSVQDTALDGRQRPANAEDSAPVAAERAEAGDTTGTPSHRIEMSVTPPRLPIKHHPKRNAATEPQSGGANVSTVEDAYLYQSSSVPSYHTPAFAEFVSHALSHDAQTLLQLEENRATPAEREKLKHAIVKRLATRRAARDSTSGRSNPLRTALRRVALHAISHKGRINAQQAPHDAADATASTGRRARRVGGTGLDNGDEDSMSASETSFENAGDRPSRYDHAASSTSTHPTVDTPSQAATDGFPRQSSAADGRAADGATEQPPALAVGKRSDEVLDLDFQQALDRILEETGSDRPSAATSTPNNEPAASPSDGAARSAAIAPPPPAVGRNSPPVDTAIMTAPDGSPLASTAAPAPEPTPAAFIVGLEAPSALAASSATKSTGGDGVAVAQLTAPSLSVAGGPPGDQATAAHTDTAPSTSAPVDHDQPTPPGASPGLAGTDDAHFVPVPPMIGSPASSGGGSAAVDHSRTEPVNDTYTPFYLSREPVVEFNDVLATVPWVQVMFPMPELTYGHPDRAALHVIDQVLAGGKLAVLSLALLTQGLGYSITTEYAALKGTGWFTITAMVSEGELDATLEVIGDVLSALGRRPLPVTRLRMAQSNAVMQLLRGHTTSVRQIADSIGRGFVSGGDVHHTRSFIEAVATLSPKAVAAAADRLFRPGQATVVLMSPPSQPANATAAADADASGAASGEGAAAGSVQSDLDAPVDLSAAGPSLTDPLADDSAAVAAAAANAQLRLRMLSLMQLRAQTQASQPAISDASGAGNYSQPPDAASVDVKVFVLPCPQEYTAGGLSILQMLPPMPPMTSRINVPLARHVRHYTMPNGIKVTLVPKPSAPGVVEVTAKVRAGGIFDANGESAVLARSLLRGCGSADAADIMIGLEEDGSALEASSGREFVTIQGYAFTYRFDTLLSMLSMCLMDSRLDDDQITLAAMSVSRQSSESGAELATKTLQDLIFPEGHPFHSRAPEAIFSVTANSTRDFYRRHFLPDTTHFIISGGFEPASMERLLQSKLESWSNNGVFAADAPAVDRLADFNVGRAESRDLIVPGSVEAVTVLGHLGVSVCSHEYYTSLVVNAILGGDTLSSRLGGFIRDKLGLTYGITSTFEASIVDGAFKIRLQAKPEHMADAVWATWQLVWQMVTYGVTDVEVELAKRSLMSEHAIDMSDPETIGQLTLRADQCGEPAPVHEPFLVPTDLMDITTADVNRALAKYIDPWSLARVTVGPELIDFGNWMIYPRDWRPDCDVCTSDCTTSATTPAATVDTFAMWCLTQPWSVSPEPAVNSTRPVCLAQPGADTSKTVQRLTLNTFGPIRGSCDHETGTCTHLSGTLEWALPTDTTRLNRFVFRWACGCSRASILHDEGQVVIDRFVDPNYEPGTYSVELDSVEVPKYARLIVVYTADDNGAPIPGSFSAVDVYGNGPDSPQRDSSGRIVADDTSTSG